MSVLNAILDWLQAHAGGIGTATTLIATVWGWMGHKRANKAEKTVRLYRKHSDAATRRTAEEDLP